MNKLTLLIQFYSFLDNKKAIKKSKRNFSSLTKYVKEFRRDNSILVKLLEYLRSENIDIMQLSNEEILKEFDTELKSIRNG